jgi:hypothetical protein
MEQFFSDFEKRSKELRECVEGDYNKLHDQIEQKCTVECREGKLNMTREELISKVKRRFEFKLKQVNSKTKFIDDVNIDDLELNQDKDAIMNIEFLVFILIDKSSIINSLKQNPFLKRDNLIRFDLDSVLSKIFKPYSYSTCCRTLISSCLIAIIIRPRDRTSQIFIIDIVVKRIVKEFPLDSPFIGCNTGVYLACLTSSNNYLILYNRKRQNVCELHKITVFDKKLNLMAESYFKKEVNWVRVTSKYILINHSPTDNGYIIEYYDSKFLKLKKPFIKKCDRHFDANENYLVYVIYIARVTNIILLFMIIIKQSLILIFFSVVCGTLECVTSFYQWMAIYFWLIVVNYLKSLAGQIEEIFLK